MRQTVYQLERRIRELEDQESALGDIQINLHLERGLLEDKLAKRRGSAVRETPGASTGPRT